MRAAGVARGCGRCWRSTWAAPVAGAGIIGALAGARAGPDYPSPPPHLDHVVQRLPADNPIHVIRPPLQRGAHLRHVVVAVVDAGDAGHAVPEHAFRDDVLDATSNRHRAPKTLGIFVSPRRANRAV